MKKIFIFCVFYFLFISKSFAEIADQFFFKPYFSLEYQIPKISGGASSQYKNNNYFEQLTHLENIVLGTNFRIHKFIGLNFNIAQINTGSTALHGIQLSKKADFAMRQYNFSVLGYMPISRDFIDLFAELGLARTENKFSYAKGDGSFISKSEQKDLIFYGVGLQITPFENSDNALRISFQKYHQKLPLIDAKYKLIRFGYLFEF
jgi:hypothetical protein